jgi:hypothetical protein
MKRKVSNLLVSVEFDQKWRQERPHFGKVRQSIFLGAVARLVLVFETAIGQQEGLRKRAFQKGPFRQCNVHIATTTTAAACALCRRRYNSGQ